MSLTPGTAQNVTLTAASSAAAATPTVTFTGTSASLSHSATLALTVNAAIVQTNAPDVTTYHYDNARDGLNSQETILTLSNVNSTQFGKIGFDTVDGKVDAEPLYLANVTVGGQIEERPLCRNGARQRLRIRRRFGSAVVDDFDYWQRRKHQRRSRLHPDHAGDRHHVHSRD